MHLMILCLLEHGKFSRSPLLQCGDVQSPNPILSLHTEAQQGEALRSSGLSQLFGRHRHQHQGGHGSGLSCSGWGMLVARGSTGLCTWSAAALPISRTVTSRWKMLVEKVATKSSFAPARQGNRQLPAGKMLYLTPKWCLLVADSAGTTVRWHR